MAAPFADLSLSILGVASEYPPFTLPPSAVETLAKRFYPDSPAMRKVLSINHCTGINGRASIGTPDNPLVNDLRAPSVRDLHEVYVREGHPLAVSAARAVLGEAGLSSCAVTHLVSTTCTDSANPGFDHFLARELGLPLSVEKVLLHGVGCAGGLAALRTAANLALGHARRGLPARVLVVALEISTSMVRSELDSINDTQQTRIGVVLFSDCAGALVLSNGIARDDQDDRRPVYDLLGWEHSVIADTSSDLGFDVDPSGWKVVLTARVPSLAAAALKPGFERLLGTSRCSVPGYYAAPADFDWAMHPGGATILSGAEAVLAITPEHMRASYDTYMRHGNSSSATIFSVLTRLRDKDMDDVAPDAKPAQYVVACAFGPGITVEMCMLRRRVPAADFRGDASRDTGLLTPPSSDSDGRSEDGAAHERGTEQFVAQALEGLELD